MAEEGLAFTYGSAIEPTGRKLKRKRQIARKEEH